MSKFFVKQCSATISTLTSAAQLYTSTGAQVQIWHWQALQTTGESQEMLPVHGCTLLNAAKSWGKYLYSSCLCSQEMCPLHLAECMTFPAWCPGQQLWQGEQWRTTAMDSRDHHPPGNCSGVIQTERERPPKMPSSNLQGRQLRFSQICIVLDLPQWLTMNSVSCSEKRKQHLLFAWPWKAEEVEDFIYSTLRHGNLQTIVTSQRALVFIFLLSRVGSVCLTIFHRQFATSLGHLWLAWTWLSVEKRFFVAACK